MRNPIDGRVHFSELKQMSRSAAHYRHACEGERGEATRHMAIGLAVDAMLFGTVPVDCVQARRGTKEWAAREALSFRTGAMLVNATEYEEALAQVTAIREDPACADILGNCEYQVVLDWEVDGVPCASGIRGGDGARGGLDALNRAGAYILDLKSTRSSEPEEMSRQAFRMHWHCQLAWYRDGCRRNGFNVNKCYILGVESSPPYCPTIIEVTVDALIIGEKELRLWIERYKACEAANAWPGYVQSIVPMTIPAWLDQGEEE